MESAFQPADLRQISERGVAVEKIELQLAILRQPPPPVRLERPCLLEDGIKRLGIEARESQATWRGATRSFEQFVPASGAATRMFAFLPVARGRGSLVLEKLHEQRDQGDINAEQTLRLLESLELFPFARQLEALAQRHAGSSMSRLREEDPGLLLELMVDRPGLELLALPKGLLPFHCYDAGPRTAFEEHLRAAATYLGDGSSPARFHFTVAAEHQETFRSFSATFAPKIADQLGIGLDIEFSLQDPVTDTIACDFEGKPVRDAGGRLLFRPGGHGSLLINLSRLARAGSGLVFIKNIDNIATDAAHAELARWKRLLAAQLLELRRQTFEFLARLETSPADPALLSQALDFLDREFALDIRRKIETSKTEDRAGRLRERLDRPLRVCGVVLNRGEPGGGPFWVRRQDGELNGQIVEGSQINHADPDQVRIWSSSSYFNPVDIVCSLHDRDGRPYDLERFVDPSTYFVATKQRNGRKIKVLERPGLWNGAMADWNTAFVEVPEQTFSPVKTLFDLLRPAHQS